MKTIKLLALIICPIACFCIIDYLSAGKMFQVEMICSYLVFVIILAYADIETFLLPKHLEDYWSEESNKENNFYIPGAVYDQGLYKTKPSLILSTKPNDVLSKVKFCITDSKIFIDTVKNSIIWIVLINTFILFLIYILNISPDLKSNDTIRAIADNTKKALGYSAIVLQLSFLFGQMHVHRTRNSKLKVELTALPR